MSNWKDLEVIKSKLPVNIPSLSFSQEKKKFLYLVTEYLGACTVLDFMSGHVRLIMDFELHSADMTENETLSH